MSTRRLQTIYKCCNNCMGIVKTKLGTIKTADSAIPIENSTTFNSIVNRLVKFNICMMNTFIIETIVILLTVAGLTVGWNLVHLDLTEDNFELLHVSVYYLRAFLCIRSTSDEIIPTLIEAPWPENVLPSVKPKIFTEDDTVEYDLIVNLDCAGIIQATATAIHRRGRLAVLDNGSYECTPKIILFNLVYHNEEIQRKDFLGLPNDCLSSIVIDNDNLAYISVHDHDFIIVYSLLENRWWKVRYRNNSVQRPIKQSFTEIALGNANRIYIADEYSGDLYIGNINTLRRSERLVDRRWPIKDFPIKFIGNLLGRPKSLIVDPKDMLYYILERDGAVLRWNPKLRNTTAEEHEVLYCDSPPITQILFGVRGSIWVISSETDERSDHCIRVLLHFSSAPLQSNQHAIY